MNLETFTDRAKGFLQSAQTVAIRMNHQRIAPEHLLKALLEDSEGMGAGLIKASGGDAGVAVREVDALLAKHAAVSGSDNHMDQELSQGLSVRLAGECHGAAESKQPQAQEIVRHLANSAS